MRKPLGSIFWDGRGFFAWQESFLHDTRSPFRIPRKTLRSVSCSECFWRITPAKHATTTQRRCGLCKRARTAIQAPRTARLPAQSYLLVLSAFNSSFSPIDREGGITRSWENLSTRSALFDWCYTDIDAAYFHHWANQARTPSKGRRVCLINYLPSSFTLALPCRVDLSDLWALSNGKGAAMH